MTSDIATEVQVLIFTNQYNYIWEDSPLIKQNIIFVGNFGLLVQPVGNNPIDYFNLLADDTFLSLIVDKTNKYAVVGVSDLRQEKNFLSFKKPKLHEKFDPRRTKLEYDIAIVKLTQKVVFSSKVQPIRLPKPDIYVPTGTSVITAGWGYTVAGASRGSDVLMEVKINIIDWKICNMLYKDKLTERVICAGDINGGVDSCHGDSGGPLELNGTLIGVVSSGGICGAPFSPGIYTKVSDFVSWINKNIDI
ncbi:anionic trypsin-2-like [Diabrotica undecimpunctata]|uniref:anionic trypsin-2-like n=1 Tax=Diabrotica undecimpunctata TaxID=50387 RepID=UPI003B6323B4